MSELSSVLQHVEDSVLSGGSPDGSRRVIQETLRALRALTDMEVAFVTRFDEEGRTFEFVDADPEFTPVQVGHRDPLESTYCVRVVDGRLPRLIKDAQANAEAARLSITARLPVGAHLSIPLHGADGSVGTLCCFSRAPDPSLRQRDLDLMEVFGNLISRHMSIVYLHERRVAERRAAIRAVVEHRALEVALQPIVDLVSDETVGFEALARFPSLVLTEGWTPDRWFDEADQVGLGLELEVAALEAAMRQMAHLPPEVTLSVNVSARVICASRRALEIVTGPSAGRLIVELTEHTEVSDYEELQSVLWTIRTSGARIAVDDAGSGYAGLQHILKLKPEVLKLDRSLVDGVSKDAGRRAMCSAMVGFTRDQGSKLVAEGVESAEDTDVLRELGVHYAQGYFLGRPEIRFPQRGGPS